MSKCLPGFCDFLESCARVAVGASTAKEEMERHDLSLESMRVAIGGGAEKKSEAIDTNGECLSDSVV